MYIRRRVILAGTKDVDLFQALGAVSPCCTNQPVMTMLVFSLEGAGCRLDVLHVLCCKVDVHRQSTLRCHWFIHT